MKFPIYKQLDAMDCGPTCLRMISKFYGKSYSLEYLRSRSHITNQGVSMLGISDAAESIGFRTKGYRLTWEELRGKLILVYLSMKNLCTYFCGFALLILVFSGCGEVKEDNLISFDIENLPSESYDFDEVFEILGIVILEETEESLISAVLKIEYSNNYYYISDNRYSKVIRFDKSGCYLNSIGVKGGGPGEFSLLSNFRLENGVVHVMDRFKILRYSKEGLFQDEFTKPFYTIDFDIRGDNYLLFNLNTPLYDQFIFLDSLFNQLSSFSPIRHMPTIQPMSGRDFLLSDKKHCYFTYPYADTIYRIVDTISEPYINYGFGQRKFSDFSALLQRSANLDISNISYSFRDFILNDYIVNSLVIDNKASLHIYDKTTKKSILINEFINGPDLINSATLYNVFEDGTFCWGYNAISQDKSFNNILSGLKINDNMLLILTKLRK